MKTRSSFLAATILFVALALTPALASAQSNADLHGGWVVAEWNWPAGADAPDVSRGLFVFTETGHYSMMYVIGGARDALGADPSDADVAAAYGPFVANSGRYSVSGNVITYEAFVAKDPAYMSQFAPTGGEGNEQTISFSFDDGQTLFSTCQHVLDETQRMMALKVIVGQRAESTLQFELNDLRPMRLPVGQPASGQYSGLHVVPSFFVVVVEYADGFLILVLFNSGKYDDNGVAHFVTDWVEQLDESEVLG